MTCAHDFPRGKVSVKVSVMEFGLYLTVSRHTAKPAYIKPALLHDK